MQLTQGLLASLDGSGRCSDLQGVTIRLESHMLDSRPISLPIICFFHFGLPPVFVAKKCTCKFILMAGNFLPNFSKYNYEGLNRIFNNSQSPSLALHFFFIEVHWCPQGLSIHRTVHSAPGYRALLSTVTCLLSFQNLSSDSLLL